MCKCAAGIYLSVLSISLDLICSHVVASGYLSQYCIDMNAKIGSR